MFHNCILKYFFQYLPQKKFYVRDPPELLLCRTALFIAIILCFFGKKREKNVFYSTRWPFFLPWTFRMEF